MVSSACCGVSPSYGFGVTLGFDIRLLLSALRGRTETCCGPGRLGGTGWAGVEQETGQLLARGKSGTCVGGHPRNEAVQSTKRDCGVQETRLCLLAACPVLGLAGP